jgi:hypothetical protein
MSTRDGEDYAADEGEPESGRVVFDITTWRCERRLPGLGLTQFRAFGADVEAEPEPFYADGGLALPARHRSGSLAPA